MTRSFHHFDCDGQKLAGTLDHGDAPSGLLIVSGGNEIRSGAHAGMAKLAKTIAKQGYPVFRYDRRGIGESSGENGEFLSSEPDILAATLHFRSICPTMRKIIAFGNCDAATALSMFAKKAGIDALILANPWVIEQEQGVPDEPITPSASAIRSRYWERLKNPRSIIDLVTGKIDIGKLLQGLGKAAARDKPSNLAIQLRDAIQANSLTIKFLLAKRDTTALSFLSAWKSNDFEEVRAQSNYSLEQIDSASHSFADEVSSRWLLGQILAVLTEN